MNPDVRLSSPLPPLPLEEWESTKQTLHLWAQIVGKIRMASTAPRNHWWHVPLYVDVRGLTTRRMHSAEGVSFQVDFDFIDHALVVKTSRGQSRSFPLVDGLSVADFDARLHAMLGELGVDARIAENPFGVPVTTPFPEDREHAAYDQDAVQRFWRILDWTDTVFEEFAGWFCGKTSPVHLFWHSFDLALTRFGATRAPAMPTADPVTREAYSHEVISFGFWAGDENVREPTYYSYTAPEPADLRRHDLQPGRASGPTRVPAPWPCSPTRRCEQPPTPEPLSSASSRAPTGRRRRRGLGSQTARVVLVPQPTHAAGTAPKLGAGRHRQWARGKVRRCSRRGPRPGSGWRARSATPAPLRPSPTSQAALHRWG